MSEQEEKPPVFLLLERMVRAGHERGTGSAHYLFSDHQLIPLMHFSYPISFHLFKPEYEPDWTGLYCFSTLALIVILRYVENARQEKTCKATCWVISPMPWWTVCISIMATQASAVTFLSTPGQAYEDGMRFLQFYFGLPLAMIILSVTAVPLYHKLKVYTAYEYLETRFDLKVRSLGAFFF